MDVDFNGEDLVQCVTRGMALLDQQVPGWERRIDLGALSLLDPCGCILGQLFQRYSDGLRALNLSYEESAASGFDVSKEHLLNRSLAYALLTQAWKRAIAARLNANGCLFQNP